MHSISMAYATVILTKRIFTDISDCKILLIGTGKMVNLAVKYLKREGVTNFFICGRNRESGIKFATSMSEKLYPLSEIDELLPKADVVITATNNADILVHYKSVAKAMSLRNGKKMCLIDFFVPRNIDQKISMLSDTFIYNVDDLKEIVDCGLDKRKKAARVAEALIEKELDSYMQNQKIFSQSNTISAYRDTINQHKQDELDRALISLKNGTEPSIVLQQLAYRLTQKILHSPTIKLREASKLGQDDVIRVVRQLYAVD